MLAVCLELCFVFIVAAMTTTGTTSIAPLILVLCFESVLLRHNLYPRSPQAGEAYEDGRVAAGRGHLRGHGVPAKTGAVLDARDVHITMAIPMMEYILAWV
jgi:FHS family L-fucose permease-like MFS transporter